MVRTVIMWVVVLLLSSGCAAAIAPQEEPAEPPAVIVPQNTVPIIQNVIAPSRIYVSSTVEIVCEAEDPDSDELIYSWTASSGTIEGQGRIINWTAPAEPGDCTIAVRVDDNRGGVAQQSVTVNVTDKPNQPPVITELTTWLPKPAGELKIDPAVELYERPRATVRILMPVLIHCSAYDPDGDQLTYSWLATDGKITEEEGPKVVWVAPTNPVRHIVTVTVTDSGGASSTAKVAFDVSCCK